MWCSSCQSEVAAKVSTDNNKLFCASCGQEISISNTISGQEKTREAQDLLQRWSDQNQPEKRPSQKTVPMKKVAPVKNVEPSSIPLTGNSINKSSRTESPKKFIDEKISEAIYPGLNRIEENHFEANEEETDEENRQTETVPFKNLDNSEKLATFHSVDIQSEITRDKPQNTNWIGFFGQLLAYGGVALLTVGTCMVLLGYFGGKEGYAPQGWLITTVGQMSLLLGIVTLVSCGIEHSSQEITNHIASLDERILRIEQAALGRISTEKNATTSHEMNHSSSQYSSKAS